MTELPKKLQDFSRPQTIGKFYKKIGTDDSVGVFSFTRMVNPKNALDVDVPNEQRCDARSKKGPSGFHDWNAETNTCSCGSTSKPYGLTHHHYIKFNQLVCMHTVMDIPPCSVIMYMELKNPEDEIKTIEDYHHEHTRTLQELFRLIIEWDFVYTNFDNREETAIVCNEIMSNINMPIEVKNWFIEEMPSEKVGRYLEGNTDARVRIPELIPDLPDFVSEWFLTKVLYNNKGIGKYDSFDS